MIHCNDCGKMIARGEILHNPKDPKNPGIELSYYLDGPNTEPLVIQPVSDGYLVWCIDCHNAGQIQEHFPTTAHWQQLKREHFPAAPKETRDAWRLRLGKKYGLTTKQKDGSHVLPPAAAAAFDSAGL